MTDEKEGHTPGTMALGFEMVLWDFPEKKQATVHQALAKFLASLYAEHGLPVPDYVEGLITLDYKEVQRIRREFKMITSAEVAESMARVRKELGHG